MIIKERREKKNWSQDKLGRKIGVSQQTIHRWENYEVNPSAKMMVLLNKVLGVSIKSIVEDCANAEVARRRKGG